MSSRLLDNTELQKYTSQPFNPKTTLTFIESNKSWLPTIFQNMDCCPCDWNECAKHAFFRITIIFKLEKLNGNTLPDDHEFIQMLLKSPNFNWKLSKVELSYIQWIMKNVVDCSIELNQPLLVDE